ncbi:MAG: RodZ domain-containing protein [Candidatus Nanopelagicaceae bacterium]
MDPHQQMDIGFMSLGSILKQARQSAGVSIDSLAERTSVRATLLRDFELDDFSKCGGDTYARGHVRNLANALGVEPKVFLERYDAEQSTASRPMHELLSETKVTPPKQQKSRISIKTLSMISASAVVLVVGGQIVYTNVQPAQGNATNTVIAATTPTPSISASAPTASSAPTSTPSGESTPTDAGLASDAQLVPTSGSGEITVLVTAGRGSSWLSVSDQIGQSIYVGRLNRGTARTFAGNGAVNIRFGNAGAVDVLVNGASVPTPGAIGEVVDRSYGSNSSN